MADTVEELTKKIKWQEGEAGEMSARIRDISIEMSNLKVQMEVHNDKAYSLIRQRVNARTQKLHENNSTNTMGENPSYEYPVRESRH